MTTGRTGATDARGVQRRTAAPAALLPSLLLALLAAAPGEVFSDLPFADARRRAVAERKLLVVHATASWCEPALRMETTSWSDPRVRAWLAGHAIAVRVDVDAQEEIASALGIHSLPAVVALRDEQPVDSLAGHQDADALLAWLHGLAGAPSDGVAREIDALRDRVEQGSVAARARLAGLLADQGRHDEALEHWLWLWLRGAQEDPSLAGLRSSFWIRDIQRLVEAYEPAREAFAVLLDRVQGSIETGTASVADWSEWVPLCRALGEEARLLAWYERTRDEQGRVDAPGAVRDELFARLVEDGRWIDAGRLAERPRSWAEARLRVARGIEGTAVRLGGWSPEEVALYTRLGVQTECAVMAAALLAAGRDDEARQVADALLAAYEDDATSRVVLVRHALGFGVASSQHRAWLTEAEDLGADVDELRDELVRALEESARDSAVREPDDG